MASRRRTALYLASVLIALAVGMAFGGGVLADHLGNSRSTENSLRDKNSSLRDQNKKLKDQADAGNSFATAVSGRLLASSLGSRSVLILTSPDAHPADVTAVTDLLVRSGARISGSIALTAHIYNDAEAEKLRGIVDRSIPAGVQLNATLVDPGSRAGDLLGVVTQTKAGIAPPGLQDRANALAALRQGGFINYPGDTVDLAQLVVVVTGDSLPASQGGEGQVVARLTAALALHGSGAVLVGRTGSASGSGAVAVVRGDPTLSKAMSTVDDVDVSLGQVSTVLALSGAIAGRPGAYGTGDGASAVAPK